MSDPKKPIPLFAVHMPPEVDAPLREVLHSGYVGQGSKVDTYEREAGRLLGNERVLALNSCTSALHLAYHLSGVKPGSVVVSTPMTCTATNFPIVAAGGRIRWADVDPRTGLIDVEDARRKAGDSAAAIACVDWGGTPCDLDALMNVARGSGARLVEDAAHAMGATYKGRPVASIPDFCCLSTQAIKHITTVDGGLLFSARQGDHARAKLLRWYGIDRDGPRQDLRCEADVVEAGWKYHMNDVNATIGLAQLPHLDGILARHRANASILRASLDHGIFYPATAAVPYEFSGSFWIYTVLLPSREARDAFVKHMAARGIMVSQVHARNDHHTCLAPFRSRLPGLDEFSSRQCSLPVNWTLTPQDLDRIVVGANEFASSLKAAVSIPEVPRA